MAWNWTSSTSPYSPDELGTHKEKLTYYIWSWIHDSLTRAICMLLWYGVDFSLDTFILAAEGQNPFVKISRTILANPLASVAAGAWFIALYNYINSTSCNTVNWLTLSFRILHLEHPPLVPWFTILLAKVTLREWWSGHQGRRSFNYHEETNGEGCRDGIRRRRGDVATHALAICLLP